MLLAVRAASPVDDLGLVDLEPLVVDGYETRRGAGRAVDVGDAAALATDGVVVVVAGLRLEPRGRVGGLDPPDQVGLDEHAERVVHGLQRDRPHLGSHGRCHGVGRRVRIARDRPEDGQALRGDPEAALAQEVCLVDTHGSESTPNWSDSTN